MTGGFVKLFGTILDSSVWGEPAPTVKVWITMLAMADKNGDVKASVSGLTRRAAVQRDECEAALLTFLSPDLDSMDKKRNPDGEGRRIEEIEGGWHLINHGFYRELRTDKQIADAERIREKREAGEYDSRGPVESATNATRSNVAPYADGDAEAYAESKETTPPTGAKKTEMGWIADLFPNPQSALAMLEGMTQGMGTPGMKAIPFEILAEAAVEIQASGGDVTPHRFKIFVQKVLQRGQPQPTRHRQSGGKTLAATTLIQKVRNHRNPQFPNSLNADWTDALQASERDVVKAFGIQRILNDTNEGTLVSQLAKALEEAA